MDPMSAMRRPRRRTSKATKQTNKQLPASTHRNDRTEALYECHATRRQEQSPMSPYLALALDVPAAARRRGWHRAPKAACPCWARSSSTGAIAYRVIAFGPSTSPIERARAQRRKARSNDAKQIGRDVSPESGTEVSGGFACTARPRRAVITLCRSSGAGCRRRYCIEAHDEDLLLIVGNPNSSPRSPRPRRAARPNSRCA